jgi:hypothetical protein
MRRRAIVVALLATGLMGCDVDSQAPPTVSSAPPPATTAPPATPSPSAAPSFRLGPDGFGGLRLGMTKAQARATGLVTGLSADDAGACGGPGDGHLVGADPSGDHTLHGRLFFSSRSNRLVAMYAFPGVTTVEGLALGDTYDQVRAAYPDWESMSGLGENQTNGRGWADVPGNPEAHFRISIADGVVLQLSLDLDRQDCYE